MNYHDFTHQHLSNELRNPILQGSSALDIPTPPAPRDYGIDEPGEELLGSSSNNSYFLKGGYYLPYDSMESHTILVGATGAGKTLLMRPDWLYACNCLATAPGLVVGFDYKGEDYPYYARQAELQGVPLYYYNPTDTRSHVWNVAKDIGYDFDYAKDFVQTIIPIGQTQEPFWNQCAQMLLLACIKTLVTVKGDTWGMHELYNLTQQEISTLTKCLLLSPANFSVVDQMLKAKADKTVDSIRLNLLASLDAVRTAARYEYYARNGTFGQECCLFSLRDITNVEDTANSGGLLLFGQDNMKIETCRPIMRVAFAFLAKMLLSQNDIPSTENHFHTSIYIDEFNKFSQGQNGLPMIMDLLTAGRSKKVSLTVACQDLTQLQMSYGMGWISFLNSCDSAVFMRSNAYTDARMKSEQFGIQETFQPSYSWGRGGVGVSGSFQKEPLYSPEFFMQMPKAAPRDGVNFVWRGTNGITQRCLSWNEVLDLQPIKKQHCPSRSPIPPVYTSDFAPWQPFGGTSTSTSQLPTDSPSVGSTHAQSSQAHSVDERDGFINYQLTQLPVEYQQLARQARGIVYDYMTEFARSSAQESFDAFLHRTSNPGSMIVGS